MAFNQQKQQPESESVPLTASDFGGNYGDVALNLPPDWSRTRLSGDQSFMLTAVGHDNGIPDAYLTDQPKQRHQFRWIAPDDTNQINVARTKHYTVVSNSNWTKNPHLWEWSGEGLVIHNGQHLYARPEAFYIAEEQEKEQARKQRDRKSVDAETANSERGIEKRGGIIYDERGRQLTPLSSSDK